jgi:hypothetical protein
LPTFGPRIAHLFLLTTSREKDCWQDLNLANLTTLFLVSVHPWKEQLSYNMNDMRFPSASPSASPIPSSSIATVPADRREPEWWWRWGTESPKESRSADHSESFILTQKRNRKQARRFPEPELYSGEADTDAQKRMRRVGSYPGSHISKHNTVSGLESEVRRLLAFRDLEVNDNERFRYLPRPVRMVKA